LLRDFFYFALASSSQLKQKQNQIYQSIDRQWKMKQEIVFPSYTTKIKEIIAAKL